MSTMKPVMDRLEYASGQRQAYLLKNYSLSSQDILIALLNEISSLRLDVLSLSTLITSATSSSGTKTGDSQSPITKPGSSRPKSTLVEPPGLDVRSTGGSSEIELDS